MYSSDIHTSTTKLKRLIAIFFAAVIPAASASLNCDIHVDGLSFDLSPLKGTHQLANTISTPPSVSNFTWLFDPCSTITRDNKAIPYSEECPEGSQICGIQEVKLHETDPALFSIIPVAGDLDGKQTGAKIELLKDPESAKSQGLRVTLKGSPWGESTELHGVIDFLCPEQNAESETLTYQSWDLNILSLKWVTKYACENAATEPGKGEKGGDGENDGKGDKDDGKDKDGPVDESESWGWFTWFFIITVLGTAAYIIAGSWVNYNRYGLSGVDILPHADLLRDIPFLVHDVIRKIAGTFSSGNSRGGYSAV